MDCIFCKIIAGEIPSDKVYEDEHVFAFRDINPQAPVHVLIVPKKHMRNILECDAQTAAAVTEAVEIAVKYQGYIDRQLRQVAEQRKMESRPLPPDLDYLSLRGLRTEARQKLDAIRPGNLGQAARISGVSPADVAALMIALERQNRPGETP